MYVPINGCAFHFGQCWFQKLQNVGLSTAYTENKTEIRLFTNHVFGLLFLPPAEVSDCFVFDFMAIQPSDQNLDKFCNYLVDTYVSEDALFPPKT